MLLFYWLENGVEIWGDLTRLSQLIHFQCFVSQKKYLNAWCAVGKLTLLGLSESQGLGAL